jgi:hypothetical protein
VHVAHGVVEGALGRADHLRADADAALVEGLDGDLVALAHLAEHVLLGDLAVLEDQLAGARRADAELVLLLADGEALEAALDEEGRDALVALRRVDVGEDDEEVASAPLVIQSLRPLSTQRSSASRRGSARAKASEPLPGSESA